MYTVTKAFVDDGNPAPISSRARFEALKRFATGAVVSAGMGAAGLSSALAATPEGRHMGNAYGTSASTEVGDVVAGLGTTGHVTCPCLGTNGAVLSNSVASVTTLNNVLRTGGIVSTAETRNTTNSTSDELTSRITNVSLLGGMITADAIVAVARTTATATRVTSDDIGTSFVNLKVAGRTISQSISPNTVLALPGIGTVTLRQTKVVGPAGRTAKIDVNVIAISVTQLNTFGLPIGAKVIAGHASSGFQRAVVDKTYSGKAFVSFAKSDLPGVLSVMSGQTALLSVGCLGTGGETRTNETLPISSGLVRFSGASTTAFADGGLSKTTSTVQGLSALNGLITASSLKAVAETKLVGSRRVRSTLGSGVVGLRVLGLPVPVNVPANTRIDLPGIGHVVINGQSIPSPTSGASTAVTALQIFVTRANLLGLPVGANITIGYAAANASAPKPDV